MEEEAPGLRCKFTSFPFKNQFNGTLRFRIILFRGLRKFFQRFPFDEEKCIYLYLANKKVSESYYSSLSVLEISLRNAIHREMSRSFGKPDWYMNFRGDVVLNPLWTEIEKNIRKIQSKGKSPTSGRVVAEMTFGFWTAMFNAKYERKLWKQLKFVFPYLPKAIRQRKKVSTPLNKIRTNIRNRVYHYEPIIWNIPALNTHHDDIHQILSWIDPVLSSWLAEFDRFPDIFSEIKSQLDR